MAALLERMRGTGRVVASPGAEFSAADAAPVAVKAPRTIHEAAQQGNEAWIIRKIERELDFNINDLDRTLKRTPLLYAIDEGHAKLAEILMDYGADPSIGDVNERTAFHIAAMRGHLEIMTLLLENLKDDAERLKALVNASDKHGLTPAFLAYQRGRSAFPVFMLLLKSGAAWDSPVR